MNHRPFEDWLINEEPLDPQQKRDLSAHLLACRSCSALAEVNLAFRNVRQVEPAPGFSSRFQQRLAARKQALRWRNALGVGLLVLAMLAGLVWMTLPWLQAVVASPVKMLTSWISSLVGLWATCQALFRAVLVLFRVAPGFIPAPAWLVLTAAFTGWCALWVFSIVKFSNVRRLVS